jgi:hypothetical protein
MMNQTAEAKPDPISITLVHNPAGERRRKKLFSFLSPVTL